MNEIYLTSSSLLIDNGLVEESYGLTWPQEENDALMHYGLSWLLMN